MINTPFEISGYVSSKGAVLSFHPKEGRIFLSNDSKEEKGETQKLFIQPGILKLTSII